MQRKAVRLLGLVLLGAAVFACLRRWLHRADDDNPDPPSEPPALTPVPDLPDLETEPERNAAPDPAEVDPVTPNVPVADEPTVPVEPTGADGAEPDGATSWVPPVDGTCPAGYPVKVNERSGIYHVPGGLSYERTRPTRCYPDAASAEADGFRRARR